MFKEEVIDGKYRAHFRVEHMGTEIARFGIEAKEKPLTEELVRLVKARLESVKIADELEITEFRVGVDVS